jgi:hypothetical protein
MFIFIISSPLHYNRLKYRSHPAQTTVTHPVPPWPSAGSLFTPSTVDVLSPVTPSPTVSSSSPSYLSSGPEPSSSDSSIIVFNFFTGTTIPALELRKTGVV